MSFFTEINNAIRISIEAATSFHKMDSFKRNQPENREVKNSTDPHIEVLAGPATGEAQIKSKCGMNAVISAVPIKGPKAWS